MMKVDTPHRNHMTALHLRVSPLGQRAYALALHADNGNRLRWAPVTSRHPLDHAATRAAIAATAAKWKITPADPDTGYAWTATRLTMRSGEVTYNVD